MTDFDNDDHFNLCSWQIYHKLADEYKTITKISYLVLIIAGFIVTGAALAQNGASSTYAYVSTEYLILAMSLLASGTGAYVSFMNPAQRWQQLRGAALNMQSHIWRCILLSDMTHASS